MSGASLYAQQDQASFITGLYQEYFQRQPNSVELNEWLGWFQRGASARDVHASFIASDEYFDKHNRNTASWINGVFATVNNRNPRPDEFNYWAARLNQLGNDRRRMASEFLRTYGEPRPPVASQPPIQSPQDLPETLVVTAQLMSQSVDREFYGLEQRLLKLQANNLVTIASTSRQALRNANTNPTDAWTAYRNLSQAAAAVNQSLSSGSLARETRRYASQIDQLLATLRSTLPTGVNQPTFPTWPQPPTNPGIGQDKFERLRRLSNRLSAEATDLNFLVASLAMIDYRWRPLANDIGSFSNDVDQFRRDLTPTSQSDTLVPDARQLGRTARRIDRDLSEGPIDIRVSQAWQEMSTALSRLLEELGIDEGQRPGNPGGRPPVGNRPAQVVQALDEAIAACDALEQAAAPYQLYGSQITLFVAEVRNLRNGLNQKRQLAWTQGNRIDVQDLTATINRLNASWASVVRLTGIGLSPLYQNLDAAMKRVYRSLE